MTPLRIGVVAEGKTDRVVLEELLAGQLKALRPSLETEFINIQPDPDATSGSIDGGWTHVKQWCHANPPDRRQIIYLGRALFASDLDTKRCDILLVILDADASEHIAKNSGVQPPPPAPSAVDRRLFIRHILDSWLWPGGLGVRERHILAAAVEAIEAWLVAALSRAPDPETITDLNPHMVEIHRSLIRHTQPSMKRVPKTIERYRLISQHARSTVHHVHDKCECFQLLISEILVISDAIKI